MNDRAPFPELLARLLQQHGYSPSRLATDSNISKSVLSRWINGQIERPHDWRPLLRVARTLGLDRAETDSLLTAAHHLSLQQLAGQDHSDKDKQLLSHWLVPDLRNLPGTVTSFVGREEELATLKVLLRQHRLITLTGPGGSGKTRLARQVAEAVAHTFHCRVYYVSLAPLADPTLVVPEIARVLGLLEGSTREPLRRRLRRHLGEHSCLLLLDNFERVVEAAEEIAELLASTPSLRVLVTSRVRLQLQGEQLFPVEPLPLPEPTSDLVALTANPAVLLFAERGQLVDHRFRLRGDNVREVAELCRRLDGLPLAIELAAARVRYTSPQQMLSRFPGRLSLLGQGPRDVPRRQQTLRETIGWSYDLLSRREQGLFRRLGVFGGGCPEDAAGKVGTLEGDGVLEVSEGLQSLVEHNLLRRTVGVEEEPRYEMLQTIQEYALERLEESGEGEATRRLHAEYYLRLAETAAPEFDGARQTYWLNRLELEVDNFRAALGWCRERGEVVQGLRLCTVLISLWQVHEHHEEGCGWLEVFRLSEAPVPPDLRAKALLWQGLLLMRHAGELEEAAPLFQQALALYLEIGALSSACETLQALGDLALAQCEVPRARERFTQSLKLARQAEDDYLTSRSYMKLAKCAEEEKDYDAAEHYWELSLAMARAAGNQARIAQGLLGLGEIARARRDLERAESLYQQSLKQGQKIESEWIIAMSLHNLGYITAYRGEHQQAAELFNESLSLQEKRQYKRGIGEYLAGLAHNAALCEQLERAGRLYGAAEEILGGISARLDPLDRADYEQTLGILRTALDAERLEALLAEGRGMSLEQALEYARRG